MAEIIEPRRLKGFRDFLPQEELSRRTAVAELETALRMHGFVPIDTPILEYADVLLGKGGGDTDKQVYRFTDHGDRDVAMRFDLTVPFARYMAAYGRELPLPFKRYHIAKVWRGENTQRGRYREFMQCDFDIVGIDNETADLEILLLINACFQVLGIENMGVEYSHRGVFNAFLEKRDLAGKTADVLRTVDKLAKIGSQGVRELLVNACGSTDAADEILAFITKEDDFDATVAKLESLAGRSEGTERIRRIRDHLQSLGLSDRFTLNPAITRGLDYYTGLVYETFLTEMEELGSVCSGGRYNDLASLYTKDQYAGVGASIGIDRLMTALSESGETGRTPPVPAVLIMMLDKNLTAHYHSIAARLRDAGLSCEVYPDPDKKLGAQFKFAEKKGIPAAVICGEDEYSTQTVIVKDLRTRESFEDLALEQAAGKAAEIVEGAS